MDKDGEDGDDRQEKMTKNKEIKKWFMHAMKEDMQSIGAIEEDARNGVRRRQMIDQSKKQPNAEEVYPRGQKS